MPFKWPYRGEFLPDQWYRNLSHRVLEAIERIDVDVVWAVVANDLPDLKQKIENVIREK